MADTESRQNGTIHWSGMINGDSIDGRMAGTMKGGSARSYTYSGTRAPEEATKKRNSPRSLPRGVRRPQEISTWTSLPSMRTR